MLKKIFFVITLISCQIMAKNPFEYARELIIDTCTNKANSLINKTNDLLKPSQSNQKIIEQEKKWAQSASCSEIFDQTQKIYKLVETTYDEEMKYYFRKKEALEENFLTEQSQRILDHLESLPKKYGCKIDYLGIIESNIEKLSRYERYLEQAKETAAYQLKTKEYEKDAIMLGVPAKKLHDEYREFIKKFPSLKKNISDILNFLKKFPKEPMIVIRKSEGFAILSIQDIAERKFEPQSEIFAHKVRSMEKLKNEQIKFLRKIDQELEKDDPEREILNQKLKELNISLSELRKNEYEKKLEKENNAIFKQIQYISRYMFAPNSKNILSKNKDDIPEEERFFHLMNNKITAYLSHYSNPNLPKEFMKNPLEGTPCIDYRKEEKIINELISQTIQKNKTNYNDKLRLVAETLVDDKFILNNDENKIKNKTIFLLEIPETLQKGLKKQLNLNNTEQINYFINNIERLEKEQKKEFHKKAMIYHPDKIKQKALENDNEFNKRKKKYRKRFLLINNENENFQNAAEIIKDDFMKNYIDWYTQKNSCINIKDQSLPSRKTLDSLKAQINQPIIKLNPQKIDDIINNKQRELLLKKILKDRLDKNQKNPNQNNNNND